MHVTSFTRRELLKAGASAAVLTILPRPLVAHFGGRGWEPVPPIQDPKIKELALRAVAASRAAGASYADVRLTHTRWWLVNHDSTMSERELLHVGVRALVEGYWGFAASPVWSLDEMSRLAQAAVHQAKVNGLGKPRSVEFAPAPPVEDGHWVMPVKRDPFEVSPLEIRDVLEGVYQHANRHTVNFPPGQWYHGAFITLHRQDRAFASTDDSYCTQRLYRSEGNVGFIDLDRGEGYGLGVLSAAGLGWELFTDRQFEDELRRLAEEMREDRSLPEIGIEVGRYDTVMDTQKTADLLSTTLGRATQLDRALGYEANANGTSYLSDPAGMLGSYQVGAPLLTVTANRSERGGCATVQWDDEGVRPEPFALVREGTLADFQTTREGAGWLAAAYAKQQRPVRSHGCATAPLGLDIPMLHTPNLVLEPGREAQDFDALVGTLKTGLAVRASHYGEIPPRMDFQGLNGVVEGRLYMVKNGRRVARIHKNAGLLFRSSDLWKGLLAVGGTASARRYGFPSQRTLMTFRMEPDSKGEPRQVTYHSATAPPALFKQLTLIDLSRQA